jgi:hypothetical protein
MWFLSGDTCNMRRSPDLKSLIPAKKKGFDSTDHFKYCLISPLTVFEKIEEITGREW